MNDTFKFEISPNAATVYLRALDPDISIESVRASATENGITQGIQWEEAELFIDQIKYIQKLNRTILFAKATPPEYAIYLGRKEKELPQGEFVNIIDNLRKTGKAIEELNENSSLKGGIFVNSGDVAFTIEERKPGKDVFGKEARPFSLDMPINRIANISKVQSNNKMEFIAGKTGYVIYALNELTIADPFIVAADKMAMSLIIVPLVMGENNLIDKVARTSIKIDDSVGASVMAQVESQLSKNNLGIIRIRTGKPPERGRKGSMKFLVSCSSTLQEDKAGKIDFKALSSYIEIKKGTAIAELIPAIPSKPGMDVFGELIPTPQVVEYSFKPGKNVTMKEIDGKQVFFSDITGILDLQNHTARVLPELIISGDAGIETGNIKCSVNVIIKGSVLAGFKVESDGDIFISDGVEDYAEIFCKGNCTIQKGVFGENTRINVLGNAQVGFIQNSYFNVKGDLTVKEFIYQSYVYCEGFLSIEGSGFNSTNKGCVIGGTVSSMKSITLHSIGANTTTTTVYCGVNPELVTVLDDVARTVGALKKQIAAAQNKIGFDLSDPRFQARLKNRSMQSKDNIREKLEDLKGLISNYTKMQNSYKTLNSKTYAPEPDKLMIVVEKHAVPQVILNIGGQRKLIGESHKNIKAKLQDGAVCIISKF